jgi:hypothetical protein
MKVLLGTLIVLLAASTGIVVVDEKKPISSQAQRMRDCNARAGEQKLHGEERRHFMSDCLKGVPHDRATDDATPGDKTSEDESGKKS